jgi:spore coat polysaccharide biosynthesis protein SpsF (cytidylyltransferase family)
MRVGCIIQARLGSTRLPRKVLADIGGWPMIRHVCERMDKVGIPVVVAAPVEDAKEISDAVSKTRVEAIRCDTNDVLQRFLLAAERHQFKAIMRVTGDCPLIDPEVCQRVLHLFLDGDYDYCANDLRPSYPRGMGCEVFTREALERAHQNAKSNRSFDREHVTPWIKRHVDGFYFDGRNVRCPIVGVENLNFSVDTQEELDLARAIDARLPAGHLKYSLETTLEAWARIEEASARPVKSP